MQYVKNIISLGPPKAHKYHGTVRFIDDLCAINDGNEFFKSFQNIYLKELELRVEHPGTYVTFLDLDISDIDIYI